MSGDVFEWKGKRECRLEKSQVREITSCPKESRSSCWNACTGVLLSNANTSHTPQPFNLILFFPVNKILLASRFRTARPELWIALRALAIWVT